MTTLATASAEPTKQKCEEKVKKEKDPREDEDA